MRHHSARNTARPGPILPTPRFLFPALVLAAGSLVTVSMLDQMDLRQPAKVEAKQKPAQKRPPAARRAADTRVVVIPAANGHFAADARVDGRPVEFLVDTGASLVTLRASEAAGLGYHPRDEDYRVRISTANGEGRAARIELESVEVGEITVRDVPAFVVTDDALSVNLLGMSFLSRVRWHHESGQLVLEQ